MAIFHFQAQVIGRSAGRSSVAASAYRAGVALLDARTGTRHNYTAKSGCQGAEIITPANAPEWMTKRELLWQGVEAKEVRQDAQLCREINAALPIELTPEQNRELVRGFVRTNFTSAGMVADVAYHHLDSNNPHAHIMLTLRHIEGQEFGTKNRDWNKAELLRQWREQWAKALNRELAKNGHAARVDHRSLIDQRAEILPTDGAKSDELARLPTIHHGGLSERKQHNENIILANAAMAKARAEHRLQPTPPGQASRALADLIRDKTQDLRQQGEKLRELEARKAANAEQQKRIMKSWKRRQARFVEAFTDANDWKQSHPIRAMLGGVFARKFSALEQAANQARLVRDEAITRHAKKEENARTLAEKSEELRELMKRTNSEIAEARDALEYARAQIAVLKEIHRRERLTPEQREAERLQRKMEAHALTAEHGRRKMKDVVLPAGEVNLPTRASLRLRPR